MKIFPKLLLTFAFVFIILLCAPVIAHAQISNPDCDPVDPCPIDGGVSALIALGIGYGIKKVKDSRKKEIIKS